MDGDPAVGSIARINLKRSFGLYTARRGPNDNLLIADLRKTIIIIFCIGLLPQGLRLPLHEIRYRLRVCSRAVNDLRDPGSLAQQTGLKPLPEGFRRDGLGMLLEHAIEGHGRDMANGGTPFQAEAAVGGDQGLAGDLGAYAAIAQDEVWQDREDRLARGTLDAPDGEAAQAKPGIMGVAGQTAAAATGGLVGQLEADREDKGEDELDEGLAVADQLKVIGLVVKIDGDGAVFSRRFGPVAHVSPSVIVSRRQETP